MGDRGLPRLAANPAAIAADFTTNEFYSANSSTNNVSVIAGQIQKQFAGGQNLSACRRQRDGHRRR
jgi:hypothetical protein